MDKNSHKLAPPLNGSFPLDHFGECKAISVKMHNYKKIIKIIL